MVTFNQHYELSRFSQNNGLQSMHTVVQYWSEFSNSKNSALILRLDFHQNIKSCGSGAQAVVDPEARLEARHPEAKLLCRFPPVRKIIKLERGLRAHVLPVATCFAASHRTNMWSISSMVHVLYRTDLKDEIMQQEVRNVVQMEVCFWWGDSEVIVLLLFRSSAVKRRLI